MEQKPHWKPVMEWMRAVTWSERAIDAVAVLFFAVGFGFLFLSFHDYSLVVGSEEYVPWLQRTTGMLSDWEGESFVVGQMFAGVISFIISIIVLKRTRILQG